MDVYTSKCTKAISFVNTIARYCWSGDWDMLTTPPRLLVRILEKSSPIYTDFWNPSLYHINIRNRTPSKRRTVPDSVPITNVVLTTERHVGAP